MKTEFLTADKVIERIAEDFLNFVSDNPNGAAAIGVFQNAELLFKQIVNSASEREIPLSAIRLYELCSLDAEHSVFKAITDVLCRGTDFNPQNAVYLTETNYEVYDSLIQNVGGLDYVLLELGDNAQLGFNEPGAQYSSCTHRQKLSEKTLESLKSVFHDENGLPGYGYTMGISNIVSAKHITVAAIGESKASAVFKMLYARTDSVVPAAFLQLPRNVLLIGDEASGSKL